jgi:hypothetical protein
MERRGYLNVLGATLADFEHSLYFDQLISRLTPDQFLELVKDVQQQAFTLEAWNGKGHTDPNFKTMCRMLQQIELFLTVSSSIKHGDIGLLRYLVDPLIVHFLGASQWNYGHEMLFYRWNLSPANSPELQHAILSSGIVNWHGQRSTHKPIDLGLEHLNGSCKIEMKCYKNSTHDTDITFDRVCLTNTWVRILRTKVEGAFGEYMPGTHTTASTRSDIFSLARKLFMSSQARPRDLSDLARAYSFESEDIIRIGMERLEEKVGWFNDHHVRHNNMVREHYPLINLATMGAYTQIDEYEEGIDERFDSVEDPIVTIYID